MRSDTELKLNSIWYEGKPVPLWLRLLEPVYRQGNRADRWWKSRRRATDLDGAVIVVVGNITAGGSGKTPLVIRLCRLLRAAGLKPGVISRGYGRKDRALRLVSPASDPGTVGDEPLLIARHADVPVIVANDRCAAARALIKKGIDVVISDDGLQHYRLPRDIEICVVDGKRGFGNRRQMPAGPLREPLHRLADFDHVVVNGEGQDLPEVTEPVPMVLVAGLLRALDSGQSWRLAQFSGCRVNAVAGIGNPGRFFDLLRSARLKVNEYPFPDHHDFSAEDFETMEPNLPVLMTEKDAVKVQSFGLKNAWSLSVEAALPHEWEAELVARVAQAAGSRK
jgi:tetraacyldisaccharide 4'-kinase